MAMRADYIWMNGEIMPWDNAKVHVFTHALHYGSSVFEGIRAYETPEGPGIFRGREHFERLLFSCKVAHIPSPLTVDEWMDVTAQVLKANQLRSAYVRPLVFRGYESLGVDGRKCPVDAILATVPWGRYLGNEAIENGIDVQVSSWRRMAPNMLSPMAKIGGQYISSQNIAMEAHDNGFSEGIALDGNGQISEGSGENIFIIKGGTIYTPPMSSSILGGITRDSAMIIARSLGYTVVEASMSREMLYMADEIFFTGTAAEITPVRSVDRMPVGDGQRGPITKAVQDVFFGIVEDGATDAWNWLTKVVL